MIFELINPSDKCTFEAPNLKIAALVRRRSHMGHWARSL